jgi:hypothetical protein
VVPRHVSSYRKDPRRRYMCRMKKERLPHTTKRHRNNRALLIRCSGASSCHMNSFASHLGPGAWNCAIVMIRATPSCSGNEEPQGHVNSSHNYGSRSLLVQTHSLSRSYHRSARHARRCLHNSPYECARALSPQSNDHICRRPLATLPLMLRKKWATIL